MKKITLTLSAIVLTTVAFAQKKELREASKLIEKGELSQAQSLLDRAKENALSETKYAIEFYKLKSQLGLAKAEKGQNFISSVNDIVKSLDEYKKLGGKNDETILALKDKVARLTSEKAIAYYNKQDFKNAGPAFESTYRVVPEDTTQLFNAALMYLNDKNYDEALRTYKELKDLGYDGSKTIFTAKNKETGKVEEFANKETRSIALKTGQYILPKEEKTPSVKATIIKQIAAIYVEQGKKDEAIVAFDEAIKAYPKDANLVLNQAMLYHQLGDMNRFSELLVKAAELDPTDANIHYNIGTIAMQQNDYDKAEKALTKALQLKPDFPEATLNLANIYAEEGNVIGKEMESLGNTKADIQKYDELKGKRENLYRKTAEVLENYTQKFGKNENILDFLKNVYTVLGDTANYKRIKELSGK